MSLGDRLRIAPSVLAADFARLGAEVEAVERAGADLIHLDVMDNHYVPNLTAGPMVCAAIRRHAQRPIEAHLMVRPVDALVAEFAKAGADIITFHPEASEHVDRTISLEVDGGIKTDNIGAVARAGADTFVAGSAIFGSADYAATIGRMRSELLRGTTTEAAA